CRLKNVRNLECPEFGNNGSFLDDPVDDVAQESARFVEEPCHRDRWVENEGHMRPSSIKSLILRPRRSARFQCLMRSAASWACFKSCCLAGTNRATGLP